MKYYPFPRFSLNKTYDKQRILLIKLVEKPEQIKEHEGETLLYYGVGEEDKLRERVRKFVKTLKMC